MMKFLEPEYKVPHRSTVTNVIEQLHTEDQQKTKAMLMHQSVALTTDNWTSLANEGYITITAHFISKEFDMKSRVLCTAGMPERHTGVNIAERLKKTTETFEVGEVSAVVRDGAANMDACMATVTQDYKWKTKSIVCAGHTNQLVAKEGLKVEAVEETIYLVGGK